MFRKLIQKLKNFGNVQNIFNPSHLGDPIAEQTDWTPARGGGTNFRTHKLVRISPDRVEFRATIVAKIFYLSFLLVGMGMIIGVSASKYSSREFSFDMGTIMSVIIGLIFTTVGGCMLYFETVPIVFDKSKGFFWKGRKALDQIFDTSRLKHFAKLENIHALQLISEYCSGKSSYYSHELNIVLKDGKRINVVDHGSKTKIREDASILSVFLEKPVWDAI